MTGACGLPEETHKDIKCAKGSKQVYRLNDVFQFGLRNVVSMPCPSPTRENRREQSVETCVLLVSLALPILRGSECPNKQQTKQNKGSKNMSSKATYSSPQNVSNWTLAHDQEINTCDTILRKLLSQTKTRRSVYNLSIGLH